MEEHPLSVAAADYSLHPLPTFIFWVCTFRKLRKRHIMVTSTHLSWSKQVFCVLILFTHATASNVRIIDEWFIGNNVRGSGRGPIWITLHKYTWSYWRHFVHDNWPSCRDVSRRLSEYEAGGVSITSRNTYQEALMKPLGPSVRV